LGNWEIDAMLRTFGKMVMGFGLLALMVAPALAQGPGGRGGFGGGFGGAMLLTNKGVQQELKVSDDQAAKLETLAQDFREKQREQREKLQDLPEDQRREKAMEMMQANNAELRRNLSEILKPEQIKRFQQIQIQTAGINAFAMPDVRETLKLSTEQQSQLRELAQDQGEAMRDIFQSAGEDREEAMRKITALRKQGMEKAMAILTSEQKETWKDMTGEPFEVRFEGGPGGGRRPSN
jgi:Spy/CpxP family protein refolding chaperone